MVGTNGTYYWISRLAIGSNGDVLNISSGEIQWSSISSILPIADATTNGIVSTTTQTFAGDKTFTGNVDAASYTGLPVADGSTAGVVNTGSQTFAGNKTFTGDINIVQAAGAQLLALRDSGTDSSNTANPYMAFQKGIASATRMGYIGFGSSSNDDLYVQADTGQVRINVAGAQNAVFGQDALTVGTSNGYKINCDDTNSYLYINSDYRIGLQTDNANRMVITDGDITTYNTLKIWVSSGGLQLIDAPATTANACNVFMEFMYNNNASRAGWIGYGSGTHDDLAVVNESSGGQVRYITNAGGYTHQFETIYGTMNMGSANSSWWHFKTNTGKFYFDDRCEANGGFHTYSDARIKTNIEDRKVKHDRTATGKTVLQKLDSINTYEFGYKKEPDRIAAGFLAQEFSEAFPEITSTAPTGEKRNEDDPENGISLSYDGLLAIAFDAIKELSAENKKLHTRLQALELNAGDA